MSQKADRNCIYCKSANVIVTAGSPGEDIKDTTGTYSGIAIALRGHGVSSKYRRAFERKFVPVYYHCEECGKEFMGEETCVEQITRIRNRQSGFLIPSIVQSVLAVLFVVAAFFVAGDSQMIGIAMLAGAFFFIMGITGLIYIFSSKKTVDILERELLEMQTGSGNKPKWKCRCGYTNEGTALICHKCNSVR